MLKRFLALGAVGGGTFVVLAPIGAFGGQEMVELCLELIEEGHDFFFLQHVRNDGSVACADFEGCIDFIYRGLGDFESIGHGALSVAFHEHVGDGETFAEHDLLDGGEQVVEEIGGLG